MSAFVAYPDMVLHGTVLFVSDVLDTDTRRTKVRIAFDNPDGAIAARNVRDHRPFMPRQDLRDRADQRAGAQGRRRRRSLSKPRPGASSRARSTSRSSKASRRSSRAASRPAIASSSRAECCSVIDRLVTLAFESASSWR